MKLISDPTLPSTKLKVQLQGEAKKHQGDKNGIYTLQPELVNGYATWKEILSRNSIWFNISRGNWMIGLTSDLGSYTAGIEGPVAEDNWPQRISGWNYGDGTNPWHDARSDVLIEDYSEGKYEIDINLKFIQYSFHFSDSYWSCLQNVWN